jgi:hypothetical protein
MVGQIADNRDVRNAYSILIGKLKGRDYLNT